MSAFATGLDVTVPALSPVGRRARDVKVRSIDVLVDLLEQRGVDTVFGIPGGAISPFNDALLDHPAINVVITRHETEAVFAACGYAMQGKKPGVAFVTSGPGATNAVTGIASIHPRPK